MLNSHFSTTLRYFNDSIQRLFWYQERQAVILSRRLFWTFQWCCVEYWRKLFILHLIHLKYNKDWFSKHLLSRPGSLSLFKLPCPHIHGSVSQSKVTEFLIVGYFYLISIFGIVGSTNNKSSWSARDIIVYIYIFSVHTSWVQSVWFYCFTAIVPYISCDVERCDLCVAPYSTMRYKVQLGIHFVIIT